MISLDDRQWKEFKIGDVFNVSGTITTHPTALISGGQTPRITCAATNNGFDNAYYNAPTEKGGVLTIDSATVGYVSYQPIDFIATDHVEKISMKDGNKINRFVGLFLTLVISSATAEKYGYGYKFSQTRIKRQSILLPVDSDNNLDWQFMSDYMRAHENKLIVRYRQYLENIKTPPPNKL